MELLSNSMELYLLALPLTVIIVDAAAFDTSLSELRISVRVTMALLPFNALPLMPLPAVPEAPFGPPPPMNGILNRALLLLALPWLL